VSRSLVDELEIEKSHADHMTSMAQYWMRRAQEAEKAAAVLIYAAGGKIVVHRDQVEDAPKLTVERWSDQRDMSMHFRAFKP